MNINPIRYLLGSNIYQQTAHTINKGAQRAFDIIPEKTITNPKVLKGLDWLGKNISSAENRLILGVTAMMSQPFIDWYNKDVDEKTRKVSVARTCAKIIAGTLTGFAIRKGCIAAAKNFTRLGTDKLVKGVKVPLKAWEKILTPDSAVAGRNYNDYISAVGTVMGLLVMTVTNFLIDAPLTTFLTNKFVKKMDKPKQAPGGVK